MQPNTTQSCDARAIVCITYKPQKEILDSDQPLGQAAILFGLKAAAALIQDWVRGGTACAAALA